MISAERPLKSYIFKPLSKLKNDILTPSNLRTQCQRFSNFVFKYSKETAFIMLGFNAISIISGHLAQIGGLKRSKRENKDYLITQEKQELLLDTVFTVIPPFLIDNFLKKQIDGGKIITKSMEDKLIDYVLPCVGASKDDLYFTEHLPPLKEQGAAFAEKVLDAVLGSKLFDKKAAVPVKKAVMKAKNAAHSVLPDINQSVPMPNLEDFVIDFEESAKKSEIPRDVLKNFYHGSGYQDIWGMRNGLLIMSTLAYTALASCIITPILKNKLSNYSYSRRLKKMGETKESIKRKQHFSFANTPVKKPYNSVFSSSDFSIASKQQDRSIYNNLKPIDNKPVFSGFNSAHTKQSGMKI